MPAYVSTAVYHAPGWEAWQAFRGGLVGTPMTERHARIEAWTREHYGNPTESGLHADPLKLR